MDFDKIFGSEALTLAQFQEKTKGIKFADLSKGEYVAKGKYDADTQKLQKDLEEAKTTISNLEKAGSDLEKVQKELDGYKTAEAERKKKEDADAKEKANRDRFEAVKGDHEWASDFARDGVYAAFVSAINNPDNIGKGDAKLFSELTKDKEGIFKSKNPSANMGRMGNKYAGKTKEEILAIKDTAERQAAMVANHELFGL